MPYGLFHAFSYQTVSDQTETVELLRRNYVGPVVPLKALQGVRPLEWEAGVSSADKDEILQGTEVTLRLQNLDGFGIKTFLSEHPREWMVRRLLNGQVEFEGFLAQHLQTEPFRKNQEFELRATDGLGGLDAEPHTDENGMGLETPVTFRRALQLALSKTGLDLALWIASELHTPGDDPARCNLDQHFYHPGQFTGDGDVPDSCQVVLTEISRAFGLVIRQREGHWEAIEPNLEGGTVKFFAFAPDGRETGPVTVSRLVSVQGAETYPEGTARAEKTLFVFDGQQIGYTQPVKSVTLKLDYGTPKNRLRNFRLSALAPARRDGVRMPLHWGTTPATKWSLPKPELGTGPDYFGRRYLRLTGRRPADKMLKSGLLSYAVGASASDAFENCFFQILAVPNAHNVKLSGRFRQFDARGAKLAVFACPFRSLAAYSRFKNNPDSVPAARDLNLAYTYVLQNGGGWGDGDAVHLFDNTETRLLDGIETEFAAPEWKGFDVSFKIGPFWNFGGLAGRNDQKLKNGGIPLFAKAGQGTLVDIQVPVPGYLLMVCLGEATDFDEGNEYPATPGPASASYIEYDALRLSYAPTGEQDTKGERFVIQAPDGAGGEVQGEVTVKLGDSRNTNYHSVIYEKDGVTPTREWFRLSNPSFKAPLLHHVAHATLSRYRAPLQHIRGEVDSARLRTGDGVRVAWPEFTGVRFLCLGTQSSARQDEHQTVLRQLPPCVDAAHTGRHYDLLQDRESLVATREGGKCYAPATGIRFTDVRQNGRYGTGTAGGVTLPVYNITLDWLDSFNRPPYKLTVRQVGSPTGADFTVNALTYTVPLPPSEYEATVENQQGKRAQVKFTVAFIEAKVGTISLVGNTLTVPVENIPGGRQTVVSAKNIRTGGTLYEQTFAPPPGSDVDTEFAVTLPPDFGTDDVEVTISTPEGESRARQSVEVPKPPRTRRYDPTRYADRYE
jgi:hypothetical protein